MINSGPYNDLPSAEARDRIVQDLVKKGAARERVNYRLRDWIFSRQHYWGEPIPVIHCPKDGAVPVPEKDLPVVLPKVEHYQPTDTGESPLAAIDDWVNVKCPVCGGPAKRETDTMPNWAGSSWYYLRYYDAHNDQAFADPKKLKYWGEVDMYLGGMEHTTLHLLYSRFLHQFFYDQGLVPTPEPYHARRGQGIILAADGSKMSKSKGNVVNPNDVLEAGYGADALRLAIAFLGPYDQTTPWSPETVAGTFRFVQRVWTLVQEFLAAKPGTADNRPLLSVTHKAIKKVSHDIDKMYFNTAVSALMELTNQLYKIKQSDGFAAGPSWQFALESLTQLLAPYAPHISEEIWQQLGHRQSVHISPWPAWDDKFLTSDSMTIVVQVNGKVRSQLDLPADSDQKAVVAAAQKDHKVAAYLDGQEIIKTIYVPGKLVSFVVR
jgi:leucyl-tRNA synthetase